MGKLIKERRWSSVSRTERRGAGNVRNDQSLSSALECRPALLEWLEWALTVRPLIQDRSYGSGPLPVRQLWNREARKADVRSAVLTSSASLANYLIVLKSTSVS